MSKIDINKYFKIHRDKYNRIFAIETIDDERELIKEIRKQNERISDLSYQIEVFTRQLENANKEVIKEKEKNAKFRQEELKRGN